MVIKIETIEKVKKIGESHYINIKKDVMELLKLEQGDFLRITIEKIPIEKASINKKEIDK